MDEDALAGLLTEWRHRLHEKPETAFEEKETAAFVAERLREFGLEVFEGIGGTGVVGVLRAGEGGKRIGLRADMDAICLTENGDLPYKSQVPGKMHGCGHDGHTTTLLGAAKLLSEAKDFNGTVCFLFQPAEEPGRGAKAMLEDGLLARFPIEEIYGFHNMPGLAAGTIHTRPGGIMASEDNFTIRITGKGGHASSPHMGIDPLVIAAQIILALQTIVSRNASPLESAVISCTEIHTDGAHNAIPTHVEITGDTRSFSPGMQKLIEERMRGVCEGICQVNGAVCEFSYTHEFAPTVNTPACAAEAVCAAEAALGADQVFGNCEPCMVSEDFGVFLERIPGCFAFLGTRREGDTDPVFLHNACFDYNDEMLLTGVKYLTELVRRRLT